MMHGVMRASYFGDDNAEILQLPYKSTDVNMFIILPKERFGLENLLKSLTGHNLLEMMEKVEEFEVTVSINL